MITGNAIRLGQASRKLNVGTATIISFFAEEGIHIENQPHAKLTAQQFSKLSRVFSGATVEKQEASSIAIGVSPIVDTTLDSATSVAHAVEKDLSPNTQSVDTSTFIGKRSPQVSPSTSLTRSTNTQTASPSQKIEKDTPVQQRSTLSKERLQGLKVLGNIELPTASEEKPRVDTSMSKPTTQLGRKKRMRSRIIPSSDRTTPASRHKPPGSQLRVSDKEIQEKIKNTLAKLNSGNPQELRAKYRKERKSAVAEAREEALQRKEETSKIINVMAFSSANDLASLMAVPVAEVLSICMSLGIAASINQRLDAETITLIADELGYQVDFSHTTEDSKVEEEMDPPQDLVPRAPVVTIMGHVDHGKTSLLDYIRKTQISKGESGGITQHIGAYDVRTARGARIAFLDTPGHEAFTAMRARGASVTDIVIIVVAADDGVMPQTKEAINHAQIAGVPIVIAINKVDKPGVNTDKIKEELSGINILVEDWGGKYQSQHISAKTGHGVPELLEKVLLEAELLALKANPNKRAQGTVLEASLDQGRGYVSTLMVQAGTLNIGDMVLAGAYYGRVKAMNDHLLRPIRSVIPATPVQILGLNGAPQAGDTFRVVVAEREAREAASRRQRILREQSLRTRTRLTLDEIGRRLSVGNFREFNVVLKGDVDGSVEALTDTLLNLSTKEVQINVIYKNVGGISASDILLAASANAIVIGFQVRPSASIRKLAEREGVEIRLYTIIYDAINDVKDALQGMLSPEMKEVVTGSAAVREIFKISKVGTVAGCHVTHGVIRKSSPLRLIREGIIIYTGKVNQIKRLKDDVQEVKHGFECGISIQGFNDIKVHDTLEGFEQQEASRVRS